MILLLARVQIHQLLLLGILIPYRARKRNSRFNPANARSFYETPVSLAPIGCSNHSAIIWKSKEHVQGKNEIKKSYSDPLKKRGCACLKTVSV